MRGSGVSINGSRLSRPEVSSYPVQRCKEASWVESPNLNETKQDWTWHDWIGFYNVLIYTDPLGGVLPDLALEAVHVKGFSHSKQLLKMLWTATLHRTSLRRKHTTINRGYYRTSQNLYFLCSPVHVADCLIYHHFDPYPHVTHTHMYIYLYNYTISHITCIYYVYYYVCYVYIYIISTHHF